MKIVVDIDNVICDFVTAMINRINQKLETKFKTEDVTVWDFVDSPNIFITKEEMSQFFYEFFEEGLWWDTLPLYSDSKDVLDWLNKEHEFIYLTNRPINVKKQTEDFFDKHNLPYSSIHILQSYEDNVDHGCLVFINGHSKAKYAKMIGADLVIDDKPATIQEYLNEGIQTVLKVEPYNEWVIYLNSLGLLFRCKNLSEFKKLIEEFTLEEEKI